jgi:hypothetical protein
MTGRSRAGQGAAAASPPRLVRSGIRLAARLARDLPARAAPGRVRLQLYWRERGVWPHGVRSRQGPAVPRLLFNWLWIPVSSLAAPGSMLLGFGSPRAAAWLGRSAVLAV